MLLGMELINNSLCPARLMLSLNVVLVSLEPFGTLWRLNSLEHNCLLLITCGDHVRLCVSVRVCFWC